MSSLDEFGLIVIGIGASVVYYFIEKAANDAQNPGSYVTIAIILLISVCTQFLVNSINRSKTALREANENLEQKVFERTRELYESESIYRTIFENTGAATIIIEEDLTISLANSVFVNLSGFKREEIELKKSFIEFFSEKNQRKISSNGKVLNKEKN